MNPPATQPPNAHQPWLILQRNMEGCWEQHEGCRVDKCEWSTPQKGPAPLLGSHRHQERRV